MSKETFETLPLPTMQSTDLQDLLMCESYFDDFSTTDALDPHNLSTTQPPTATMSEFESQIQAILAANAANSNNGMDTSQQINDLSFDNFQYQAPSPETSLFNSPEIINSLSGTDSFLNSPNYTIFDDNGSLSNLSPLSFNSLQDFTVPPSDAVINDVDHFSLMEKSYDPINLTKTEFDALMAQVETPNKEVSTERESNFPERSLKKKRKGTGSISKSVKKTKDDNISFNEESSTVPSMGMDNRSNLSPGIQSIVVPSSPIVNTTDSTFAFNPASWSSSPNQPAVNFASDEIMDTSQLSNVLSVLDDKITIKKPIPRLKNVNSKTQQHQQNFQFQPNKQQKKVAHNAIERRYRNNINDRINDLKNVVPALCHLKSKDSKDDDEDDKVDGISAATKLNKATILRKATEYIIYLKKNNQKLKNDNELLKKLIKALSGGIELYNLYHAETNNPETPPSTSESGINSDYSDHGSPYHNQEDFEYIPPSPPNNTGSRALMALFMCMTFFSSQSNTINYGHHSSHHHNDNNRVVSNEIPVEIPKSSQNDGAFTIDIWYLARIFTFIMCLTYIIRPSLFSNQSRHVRKSKSIIASVITAKGKDAKTLYQSLSHLSYGSMNTLEFVIGFLTESFKFFARRSLGWNISGGYISTDMEEKLWEVALWARLGEVELCGGNDKASRLSILYTCFRTINLLESHYISQKNVYINPARIYANAALQCYIGFHSIPFISQRIVSHFWKLAKERRLASSEEKWLEIVLVSDPNNDMWKGIANKISNHVISTSKGEEKVEPMNNTTIPLAHFSDAQALFHLKKAFSNLVSVKYGKSKKVQKSTQYTFSELLGVTTPASLTHWYALVGCAVQAFSVQQIVTGEKLVNRLREEFPKTNDNVNKQIIAMGLLTYALLMHGKVEASIRCADKANNAVSIRNKEEKSGITENDDSGERDLEREMIQDVHDLAEFCVGWVVLEARILSWKIIEEFTSENNDKAIPDVLDIETRLKPSINGWMRYLRRLPKANVFGDFPKAQERFIKKLDALGRIVGGTDESADPDCEFEENNNTNDDYDKECSEKTSETKNRAIRAWNVLKGM
ncbi:hypothetical protein Glove_197g5 [Diversispora epigaea]|uniref:BHLH domain-containing protein n=1 Tax=Diversispora epigaea TaxID=1348612 RepID=A0A397IQD4_9GLOM|nr:hypothetical protein Glove_197g5 [Diversispora epigaea]